MKIIDATHELVKSFYGEVPFSCRAIAAVEDDRVLGIAGIKLEEGYALIFSDMKDAVRLHPLKVCRAGKQLVREAKEKGLPVYAQANPEINNSAEFLMFLGFKRMGELWLI